MKVNVDAERPAVIIVKKHREKKRMPNQEYTEAQVADINTALDSAVTAADDVSASLDVNDIEEAAKRLPDVLEQIAHAKAIIGDPIGPGRPSE